MTPTRGTVLVADDDKMSRILLSGLLEHEGYAAKTVGNGRDALAAIEAEPFDAILLDILMPDVDGVEVLQKVKYDSRLWHIPVIMISAVEERDSIVRCLELGADDYVVKPFDPVVLRARINACLARRRFRDLEGEYRRVMAEQASELDDLTRSIALARLGRFLPAPLAERALAADRPQPPPPHRREVAVVSGGLTGVGARAGTVDPSEAIRVLNELYDVAGGVAARFEATLVSAGAGSITVVLNDPDPCPDPARQALRMAEALGEALARRLVEWSDRLGGPVGWGAGLGLGEAVLGHAGSGGRWDYEAVGPAVDRAVRLRTFAPAGGIVLDHAMRAALGEQVVIEAIGPEAAVDDGIVSAYRFVGHAIAARTGARTGGRPEEAGSEFGGTA